MEPTRAQTAQDGKTSRRTLLWQRAVLGAFIAAARSVQGISRRSALRFGRDLGRLARRADSRRCRYADANLRLAYGNTLSASERSAMIQRIFEHWGKSTIEFLRGATYGAAEMNALVSSVEGREYLDTVRAGETGFIIVTGHIGNFEFLGRWMAAQGVPSTVVARAPGNPAFAAYLQKMREFGGNVALPKGATSAKDLLTVLKRKQALTLGVDQNSGDLMVPFFGVPAGTVSGPATLALRTGVPLLPAFCVWDTDDRYRIIFLPPIQAVSTGNKEADTLRVTTEVSNALELVVRRYPDQWLWLHNRWKGAFEETNRARWPEGYDFEAARSRWQGVSA